MARWVDYHLGRRGTPRAHPTGQPGAMAPQRRGAVAAPSRDPTRQANPPTQPGRRPPDRSENSDIRQLVSRSGHTRLSHRGLQHVG
jgi:hypothetical protein